MDDVDRDKLDSRLLATLDKLEAARAARRRGLEIAFDSKDLNTARNLVVHEIEAERQLKQATEFFGHQADTWYNRAELSMEDPKYHSEIRQCFTNMQCYAEAELECQEELRKSETRAIRVKLLEMEAELASEAELKEKLETWSKRAEIAPEGKNKALRDFALAYKQIYQNALDKRALSPKPMSAKHINSLQMIVLFIGLSISALLATLYPSLTRTFVQGHIVSIPGIPPIVFDLLFGSILLLTLIAVFLLRTRT